MARPAHPGSTIAAIASPPGGGLRGILRVSGSRAREIALAVWAGDPPPDLRKRSMHAGRFRDGRGDQPLLLLWMPGPRSFTREDVAEFHLPGSPPLLQAALARVLLLGAVPAQAGEFTRRAFLSGRIDLTRAEGVLALVAARDDHERRAGIALLSGGLAGRIDALRDRLEDLRALCEASLDFDERDTGHVPDAEIEAGIRAVRDAISEALSSENVRVGDSGEESVVLAGASNAGKSSLFNRLARAESAIVSPVPGTTRDIVTARIDLRSGLGPRGFRLVDTAGIGPAIATQVDREARECSERALEAAGLVVWVVDASAPVPGLPPQRSGVLLAWNKIDLPGTAPAPPPGFAPGLEWLATSARTGAGLPELEAAIARELGRRSSGESAGVSREISLRHRAALVEARAALTLLQVARRSGAPLEIQAEHLRAISGALDAITGSTTTEDVLDRIFVRFCLGK